MNTTIGIIEIARDLALGMQHTLPDGRILRFTEEPDTDTNVNDFDCYGRVQWIARNNGWAASPSRPDGFDGAAEILSTHRGDRFWWQPVTDKADRRQWHNDPDYRHKMRQCVLDILNYGFTVYRVTVFETCDDCGTEKAKGYAAIGGMEPFLSDDDKCSNIEDLIVEVLA